MRPIQHPPSHQANLRLFRTSLWEKFPESHRVQCREILIQLLRRVVLEGSQSTEEERSDDE